MLFSGRRKGMVYSFGPERFCAKSEFSSDRFIILGVYRGKILAKFCVMGHFGVNLMFLLNIPYVP